MLELAQPKDREAVEALAQQVQGMHLAWRPDLFAEADCLYPEERFQEAVRKRELYVAKLGGEVAGYALLLIAEIDAPALTKRRIMKVEELCVEESCRGQGIGRAMMEDILSVCRPETRLCIAADITLPDAFIRTASVGEWKKSGVTIGKRPCVFIIQA